MHSFSERKGLKPIRSVIQKDNADSELRMAIWNTLYASLFCTIKPYDIHNADWQKQLTVKLWLYFGYALDKYPSSSLNSIVTKVKSTIVGESYYAMYDLVEYICQFSGTSHPVRMKLIDGLNFVLNKYLSAYRIVGGIVTDITSEQEISSIEQSLTLMERFQPVKDHLSQALKHLSDRENPDYRNSIKESISAVESAARILMGEPKPVLSDLLKRLEKEHKLHQALAQSYLRLYGYSSDADGIRHSLTDEPNLSADDAKFMLVNCSAFTNYLVAKLGN